VSKIKNDHSNNREVSHSMLETCSGQAFL